MKVFAVEKYILIRYWVSNYGNYHKLNNDIQERRVWCKKWHHTMKNMNFNEEKQENCNEEINHGCSCGSCHEHEHDHSCCEEHGHEHGHGCCEDHEHHHDHDGEEHGYDTLTMILEDNSELECPIIEVFEIGEQGYIALLHPVTEKVLLYRFNDYEDDTIDIELIEDDDEFELVTKTFRSLQDEE